MQGRFFLFVGAFLFLLGTTSAASGVDAASHMLMFDPESGQWFMNRVDGSVDSFHYGSPGDVPLVGDWDCDGEATVGAYRPGNGYVYVRNSNDQGFADREYFFGEEGDIPIAGDWDGDGCDTVSVYRNGQVYVSNSLITGEAEYSFYWGTQGDSPFGGDFDGDGVDTVGSYRESSGFVYLRNELTTGIAELSFFYGIPGDTILAGDWDEDGVDSVGIYRPSLQRFFLSNDNEQGAADIVFDFASSGGWLAAGRATPRSVFDVDIFPGDNIQAKVDANPAGTNFVIRSGIHRQQRVQPKNSQVFLGEPGAVLTGARKLTGWIPDGGRWYVTGQTQEGTVRGKCDAGYERCSRPEDLFVDDVTFRHVTSLGALGAGAWYFDYGADRIYIGEDPTGHTVETSVTRSAFFGSADGVVIRDLVIEKYATPAQEGAIDSRANNLGVKGTNWVVDNVEARLNHGTGVHLTDFGQLLNSFAHHNGQQGVVANGTGVLVEGTEISFNNTARFRLDWEGGGTKFVGDDIVIRNNHSHDNYGTGLWFDINSQNGLIEGNTVERNFRAGIFFEVSKGGVIRNNYAAHNGLDDPRGEVWLWSGGITVASSEDVEIYGNTLVNNANGITAIQQARGNFPWGDPRVVKNLFVHDNHVTMDRGHTGAVQDIGDNAIFTSRNNRFVGNVYVTGTGDFFHWDNRQLNFDEWRSYGQE